MFPILAALSFKTSKSWYPTTATEPVSENNAAFPPLYVQKADRNGLKAQRTWIGDVPTAGHGFGLLIRSD